MQSSTSYLRHLGLGAAFAAASVSLHAQNDADADWNHFGLNFRSGFNIRARFSDNAGFTLPPGPGAGPALNHQYNDGFVNVDSSGNAGGQTWNWGYQHAPQISGGDLLLHASGSLGASEERSDDPNLGFNFNYVRDLGHYNWGQVGVKFAFGYTHVQVNDSDPMASAAESITDKYALNGITPPIAPYSGSFSGPGPVIGSEPISRTTSLTGSTIISGNHNIDASLFDLRIGPSLNIPLWKQLSLQLDAGLALGIVDSHFSFAERSGGVSATGSDDSTGFIAGGYGELGFAWKIRRDISIYTGAQFESLGNYNQSSGSRAASLQFGQSIFYELGLQWEF